MHEEEISRMDPFESEWTLYWFMRSMKQCVQNRHTGRHISLPRQVSEWQFKTLIIININELRYRCLESQVVCFFFWGGGGIYFLNKFTYNAEQPLRLLEQFLVGLPA